MSSGASKLVQKSSLRFLRARRRKLTSDSTRPPSNRRPSSHPNPKPSIPLLTDIKSTDDLSKALQLFYSADPHEQDYPCSCALIYRLARARNFHCVDTLLEYIRSQRIRCSVTVFNVLIKHYGKAKLPGKAIELFHSIPTFNCPANSPTLQNLNFLLDALVESGGLTGTTTAEEFLLRTKRELGVRPNVVSYNIVIKGWLAMKEMDNACKVLDEMLNRRVNPSTVTYNMMIGFLTKNGSLDKAMALKEKMSRNGGVRPNAITYALLMEGMCREGKYGDAKKILFDMDYWGCKPKLANYGVLMSDRCRNGSFEEAKELVVEMKKRKYKPDVVTYNILVNYLCKEGRMDEANKVMMDMEVGRRHGVRPDASMYRMIVDGFCRIGEFEKGLGVMNTMLVDGHCPREETFRCMIGGLCSGGRWSDACLVASEMEKRMMRVDLEGWGALVGGLCLDNGGRPGSLLDHIITSDHSLPRT